MDSQRKVHRNIRLLVASVVLMAASPAVAESVEGRVAAAKVSEESYRHYLDDMLYTHAGDDRSIIGPEHDPARDNIALLLESFGLTVTLEPFLFDYPVSGTVYYNVVGTKLGTTYPDQEYIVGAHYDSEFNPGADDNASGVALVLEAARLLSTYDSEYTIRFIAFDVEEWGKVGAYAYVDDHAEDDILGMISADMVAHDAGGNIADIYCTGGSAPLQSTLAQAVDAYGDGLSYELGPGLSGSDHWPFEQAGYEACLLIEDNYGANPFYHTLRDNVDEPDYLDYAYATRMTRSIIGFLVDSAGVNVDIPDADYDIDGDVDEDDYNVFASCFTGTGIPPEDPDCNFFDFDSDGDIDCTDWDLFVAVWTGPPVDPPAFWGCEPQCLPSSTPVLEVLNKEFTTPVNRKNRFISVSLIDAGRQQAIRVVLGAKEGRGGSIPPPFGIWKGLEFYAGAPRQYCENAGQGPTVAPNPNQGGEALSWPCAPADGVYKNGQIWFWAAPLVCEKGLIHWMDWTTLADHCNTPGNANFDGWPCDSDADCGVGTCGVSPVVHLFHEAVVPSHMAAGAGPVDYDAVYEVSVIDDACPLNVASSYSPPVQILQAPFGDVNESVAQFPNGPPNEIVGVTSDVVGLLNKFANINGAMQKTRTDIVPCRVDFTIGIPDIVASLNAFIGGDYEDVCGAGNCHCTDPECSAKQCSGGPDHGILCETDDDCSSDPCTEDLSREIRESLPGLNLPVIDTRRNR